MLFVLPLLVLAHGAYPLVYRIDETPGRPTQLAAGTSFGIITSDDDGLSWRWICEEAVGYGSALSPVLWVSPQGALLAGSFKGLFSSNDRGCTWSSVPQFGEQPDGGQGPGVADLYDNGAALFATTSKYGVVNRVWRSMDQGATWSPLTLASNGEFYTTLRSAPSRPQRLYVASWWFRPSPTEALYWSDDQADHFTRVDVSSKMPSVPLADGGAGTARGAFYVYAVDPLDPDTLYAGLQQDDDPRHSFALRSADRGESWQVLLDTQEQLSSVVVSADGRTLWVATTGPLYASVDGGAFAPYPRPTRQACAARYRDRFYACGWPEADGFAVARSVGEAPLAPLLNWSQIEGVPQCPATSKVATLCASYFPALLATFPKADQGDAGVAPADAGTVEPKPPGPNCGCAGAPAQTALALLMALVSLKKKHCRR